MGDLIFSSVFLICYYTAKFLTAGGQYSQDKIVNSDNVCEIKCDTQCIHLGLWNFDHLCSNKIQKSSQSVPQVNNSALKPSKQNILCTVAVS